MKRNIKLLFGLLACACLLACGDDKPVVQQVKAEKKPGNPFPFYKNIEIRPGLNFEIVSWGKGVDSVGGFSIFMSDSLKRNYKAVSAERKGKIVDAFNLDLDTDGNPELYVQLLRNKNESDLLVYEFDDNEFHKISFPSLSDRTRKIFLGNDKFFIKNGDLLRTIPVKDDADASGKGTKDMTVTYQLRGNTFSIQ